MKDLNPNNSPVQDNNSLLIPPFDEAAEAYWLAHLSDELPALNFPKSAQGQFSRTHKTETVTDNFPRELTEKLKSFAVQNDVSLRALLMAAVNILLYKYTRQTDIIVAAQSSWLMHEEDEGFANTLLIRTAIDKNNSVKQLLVKQQVVLHEAFEHRHFPFDKLREKLRTGLPEVFVGAGSYVYDGTQQYGISFLFATEEELQLNLEFDASVYSGKMMRNVPGHFREILLNMMVDDAVTVKEIDYLTEEEVRRLADFNDLKIAYPAGKTLIDLFEEQAKKFPAKHAVVSEGAALTYQELDELSDRLANYLTANGVQSNSCVLFCFNHHMERSLVGILGIMKAGCAYVPLDSDLPKERISYLVRDTKTNFVVTNSVDAEVFANEQVQIIRLDETSDWCAAPLHKERAAVLPGQLAYVIYTSGTTGDPKGVMINHRNLLDYFYGLDNSIGIADCKSNALMSTLATDLGNTLLFASLIYGNTLHLFSKDALRNIEYLHQYFNKNAIDCIKVVPTYWNALEYAGRHIYPAKMIIFGGEQLPAGTVNKIRAAKPALRIVNHYGPTETTVGKLLHEIKNNAYQYIVPIGKPFSNTCVYVVDECLSLCAQGVWGELIIGGDGVFQGYLNNPALTAEKCIENHYRFPGQRLYRTGDQVRINENGEIEFGSRIDDQVKIQGYRIELGGIEAFIRQYPAIKHCFVNAADNGEAGKMLVAYLEVTGDYNEKDFRQFLELNLPVYMIPSMLVQVPELPMKSNGKVDKKKLFAVDVLKAASGYEAPATEVQQVIVGIMEEIFNKKQIGITDNFYELGGDSIKSIQLASRLRQRGYKLQLKDIIRNPVIKDLSTLVKAHAPVKMKEDHVSGIIPFSPIQKSFFESRRGNYHHYNQSVVLFAENLNAEYVEKAFSELVKFHDTLRIKFRPVAGAWEQHYDEQLKPFQFECLNYADENAVVEKMMSMGKDLNIQHGPLTRICLFKGEGRDILYIVVHHLLIDGVSFRILVEDLSNLYRKYVSQSGFELRNKSNSLKEWHAKLLDYSTKEALLTELPYWQAIDKTSFDKITVRRAASNTIGNRERHTTVLDEATTSELLTKCYKRYNTETIDILLAALSMGLQEVFGLQKLTLNLEGHGREYIGYDTDVSRTLGWFTTIFPVHLALDATEGTVNNLMHVKDYLAGIPVKGIGYGVLKYLKGADLTVQPEITYNYLGDFSRGLTNGADENIFSRVGFNYQDASELTMCNDILTITSILEDNQLLTHFSYNKLLITGEQIEALGAAFRKQLLNIIHHIALS